ncbi:hypothetical protein BESB_047510 [Besnoitia besnoiti]|uniref:RING-type domain-containing protein n=1 Tax=Besnoitia besnoiti TaxID=94643 RepID=A0A2A9MF81_BESBE|nr:hypothetical protein BESB_047510 [Besnoitia besnoiti]PFH36559.1 hypothetical protein BESB_047510 [Besnoitia besnoiti]
MAGAANSDSSPTSFFSSAGALDSHRRREAALLGQGAAAGFSSPSVLANPSISAGLHNTLCVLAGILLLLWFLRLLRQLIQEQKIRRQFAVQQHPLHLRGLARYSWDLQRLFRIHFEKLVRNYNPASPLAILRVRVAVQTKAVIFPSSSSSSSASSFSSASSSSASSSVPSSSASSASPSRAPGASETTNGAVAGEEARKWEAAVAALGEAGRTELEFLLDACDAATLVVYWGVDAEALQKALAKKADEVSVSLGVLDRPLHFPRSLRRIFGARRLAACTTRRSAAHSEASRSLLELEERDGLPSSSADRDDGGEGASRLEAGAGADSALLSSSPALLSPSEYRLRSAELTVKAGMHQRVRASPADRRAVLGNFAGAGGEGRGSAELPLVVVASLLAHSHRRMSESGHLGAVSVSEASTHVLILRRNQLNSSSLGLELAKEVMLGGGLVRAQERLDVYGLEEGESVGGEKECLVCMTNAKDVMLYPCRHCSLCFDCLRSLHQERCPICRSNFSAFVTFPFKRTHALLPSAASPASLASLPAADGESSPQPYPLPGGRATSPGGGGEHAERAYGGARSPGASSAGSGGSRRTLAADLFRAERYRRDSQEAADAEGAAEDEAQMPVRRLSEGAWRREEREGRERGRGEGLASPESNRGMASALLEQLRQYVQYDELGSELLSDSDT